MTFSKNLRLVRGKVASRNELSHEPCMSSIPAASTQHRAACGAESRRKHQIRNDASGASMTLLRYLVARARLDSSSAQR